MNVRRTLLVFALSASVLVPLFASDHSVPTNVAYVSEEGGRISILDLNSFRVLAAIQPKDIAPRGISLAGNGRYVATANKGTADVSIFDARNLRLIKRIHLSGSPEFVKLHPSGKWLFVSCETVSASTASAHTTTPLLWRRRCDGLVTP